MKDRWLHHWFREAALWASMSKDPSTKVGAVLVEPDLKRSIATGYNGLPAQVADHPDILNNRDLKYARVIHAELNAVLNAARYGRSTAGAIVFVTTPPCGHDNGCAKLLLGAGVSKVFAIEPSPQRDERIGCSAGRSLLLEGGVRSVWMPMDEIDWRGMDVEFLR